MSSELTTMPKKAMAATVAEWVEPALNVLRGEEGRARSIARLREVIRSDYEMREAVIKAAEGGDLFCHEALEAEFNEMLDTRPGEIPASMRAYHQRKDRHPKRKRGKYADEWVMRERDAACMILMARACESFSINLNHNEANDRPCATEVVSAALRLKGIKVPAKTLSRIATKKLGWFKAMGWWFPQS
jgi:hypothetical protein